MGLRRWKSFIRSDTTHGHLAVKVRAQVRHDRTVRRCGQVLAFRGDALLGQMRRGASRPDAIGDEGRSRRSRALDGSPTFTRGTRTNGPFRFSVWPQGTSDANHRALTRTQQPREFGGERIGMGHLRLVSQRNGVTKRVGVYSWPL